MLTFDEFKLFETPLPYTVEERLKRVHIGLVQLNTDHSLEMDWAKLIGTQAAVFSSRVFSSSEMNPEALDSITTGISDAASLIAVGLPMDVMAFGCTSASIVIGEEKVAQLLTENRGDIPATNPWAAAQAAFKHLGATKVAVFAPYPTSVNYPLYQQLIQAGFVVPALGALGIEHDTEITLISKDSILQGVRQLLAHTDAEVLFMSCTNLRALDHIQYIEDTFGIPVVTSTSALFWHTMHLSGQEAQCPGYGRLLNP